MNTQNNTIIFTDGASRGNPGPGGWGAVIVHDEDHVIEIGGHVDDTTNNRMELTAVIGGLMYCNRINEWKDAATILTDSKYVRDGATKWVHGWVSGGWVTKNGTAVKNKELWKDLYDLTKTFELQWKLLPGHSGVYGNKRADAIATGFADEEDIKLFDGSLQKYNDLYDIDLLDISVDEEKIEARKKKSSRSRKDAYSYLSLVDGDAKRHETWEETKRHVSGQSGAKYRKTISEEDEQAILEDWGVDPESLE